MANIRPFKAMRPSEAAAARIAALPYDVYSREEAKQEVAKEPLSFLRIDRAETNFDDDVDTYDDRVYKKAGELLEEMEEKGYFITDAAPSYYIYELTMDGRTQTGIVAAADVEDYLGNVIKRHENTLKSKEEDRVRHVDALSAQTGPIFLGYRANEVINGVVSKVKGDGAARLYDFTSEDGITHRCWRIDEKQDVDSIRAAFEGINEIYICDGHHRCASAVRVCMKRREAAGSYTGEEEFNYFLCVLFPDEELKIYDYNRVVKDLNSLSESRFLDRIRKKFIIEELGEEPYRPEAKGNFGMYLGHRWYRLTIKEGLISDDTVEQLDVSILQNELLAPILNIEDPKTDRRISFVGGIRGLEELVRLVDSGKWEVAFSMYPTDIHELFQVADENRLMSPKSTWFEPKLRSGLFIHKF